MNPLVPNRLLFRFEIPIRYRSAPPVLDGQLDDWADDYLLPDLGSLDGARSFAHLWLAWNEAGLYLACRVEGRRSAFQCDPKSFWKGDNLRLMTDMRDTRDLKRGSRYCQQFYFLPCGGGRDGSQPVAGSAKVHRAADHAPLVPPGLVQVACRREGSVYCMEGHVPAAALAGFEPQEHPRIGFYTLIEDRDRGQQYLTVGDDLNWYIDPSTWATGVLTR